MSETIEALFTLHCEHLFPYIFFFLKKWVKSFTLLCARTRLFFILLLSTVHILIFESISSREKKINRRTIGKITLREWLQGLWEMVELFGKYTQSLCIFRDFCISLLVDKSNFLIVFVADHVVVSSINILNAFRRFLFVRKEFF